MNQLYFSIESRKGGVGKTTIALNMCQMLRKKGYAVLMLDCDITGTSSAESSENSDFWKEDINVIKYFDKKSNGKKTFNLLTLFCKRNSKEKSEEEDDAWSLDNLDYNKNKINIIGSDLYEGKQLIVDPRYLMDEIHSYWVVSMLKDLIEDFFNKFEKAAIIIDNSPGYVGLGRAIHEWFTDLGPEKAHFLLVSSIDEQDVKSSISAAIEIRKLMEGKIRVARYFKRLKKGEEQDDNEESFLKSDSHFDRFFYRLVENDNYPKEDSPLSKYAAIIFNRVLPECLEDDSNYKFSDLLKEDEQEILKLISNSSNINSTSLMIPYDPLVNTQFYGKYLHYRVIETKDYWTKRFERLSEDVKKYFNSNDVINAAYGLTGYLNRLKASIESRGSRRMAASIKAEWLPAYCMTNVRSIVDRIAYYSRPDSTLNVKEFDRKEIVSFIGNLLDQYIKDYKLFLYSPVLHSILNYLNKLAGAEKNNRNIQLLITISLFFNTLIIIHREEYKGGDYRSFLIQEASRSYKSDYSRYVGAYIPITKDTTINRDDYGDILGICFDKFYSAVCYALIRLVDLKKDYNHLVSVLQTLIVKLQKNLIPMEVRDFLDRIIVKKEDAKDNKVSIEKIFSDAYSMSVFEDVLQKIIFKNWNL